MNSVLQKITTAKGIWFVLALWLLSRIWIVIALQVVAPLVFTSPVHPEWGIGSSPRGFVPGYMPQAGWEIFSHWDGKWYQTIAAEGYEYVNDGTQHSIAFFPLFPLLVRGVMLTGLPFEPAGVLVNTLAFLGAMVALYFWAEESQSTRVAKWAIAVLAWCPSSVFGSVTQTEGTFLLVTTMALWSFDKQRYGRAALWGALASATRVPGVLLVPAFLFVAWRERRPAIAYVAGLATSVGALLFSLYAAIEFGDPLASIHTHAGWDQNAWVKTLQQALALDRPSILVIIALFASLYLLWRLRSKLPPVAIAYAFCVLLLLISAGSSSFYRFLYAIPTTSFGVGVLLAARPRFGYVLIGFFGVSLFIEALHFASWDWIRWN